MIVLTENQKKAIDINKNTVVIANAGSGKTFILTQRFLETISKKSVKYNEIIAITFTEKAAGELQSKISLAIEEKLKSVDKEIANSLKTFRQHIVSAKISTIHSFCLNLIKQFPIESGIDPTITVIEDRENLQFIDKAIEETLLESIENEQVRSLLKLFGKDRVSEKLSRLIQKRYLTDKLIHDLYFLSESDTEKKFELYYNKIWKTAEDYFFNYNFDFLTDALEKIKMVIDEIESFGTRENEYEILTNFYDQISQYIQKKDLRKIFEKLYELSTEFPVISKKYQRRKNIDYSFFKELKEFLTSNKKLFESNYQRLVLEKMRLEQILTFIDLYLKAKTRYNEIKTLHGVVDFDDILIITDKILDFTDVREELSNRFKFILVDEFQDTDSIQYSILKKITNGFDDTHNIFVVGDEKQSIYAFRNAELKVFQQLKDEVRELNKKRFVDSKDFGIINLSESYRTTPTIAGLVNKIFSKLIEKKECNANKNYHESVEYTPLSIGKNPDEYLDEPIEIIVGTNNHNDKTNLSELIAKRILNLVISKKLIFDRKKNIYRSIQFSDIALLFRKREEIKEYENVFIRFGIPFIVSGGRGYFQTEEISDFRNYLKFIISTDYDYSLIAILRSPFFACSDTEIFKIYLQNGKTFFEKLEKYVISNPLDIFIKNIYEILKSHIEFSKKFGISILLQKILQDTFYTSNVSYHPRKNQIVANINKFINLAHQFEMKGFRDINDFIEYLELTQFETETAEATISEIENCVELMTVHQAKGMEFPVVILPNLHQEIGKFTLRGGTLEIEDNTGIIFKLKQTKDSSNITGESNKYLYTFPVAFGELLYNKKSFNENLRVWYVALTRSSEILILGCKLVEEINADNDEYLISIILKALGKTPEVLLNENQIKIPTQIKFLREKDGVKNFVEEQREICIDIIRSIQHPKLSFGKDDIIEKSEIKPLFLKGEFIESIQPKSKLEIFTSTQINTYEFCPRNYLLKYVIGYHPTLFFEPEKDESTFEIGGAEFGNLFHSIMKKVNSLDFNEINSIIENELKQFTPSVQKAFYQELQTKFKFLFRSENFQKIFESKNSLREFEIKSKIDNHILMGVIDRININENEITIIDYKTDTFDINEYDLKVIKYKTQMDVYAFLAYRYFGENKKINLIIFFINFPDKPYQKSYDKSELLAINNKIREIISKIEMKDFSKNTINCQRCEYFINSKCIL